MATHVMARLWRMLTMMLCGRVVIPIVALPSKKEEQGREHAGNITSRCRMDQ